MKSTVQRSTDKRFVLESRTSCNSFQREQWALDNHYKAVQVFKHQCFTTSFIIQVTVEEDRAFKVKGAACPPFAECLTAAAIFKPLHIDRAKKVTEWEAEICALTPH